MTKILRTTITPVARLLFEAKTRCRITLSIPPSPQVLIALDLEEEDITSVRAYDFAPVYAAANFPFCLEAGQKLYAICAEGKAHASVIVEAMP